MVKNRPLFLSVNLFRRFKLGFCGLQIRTAFSDRAEKARSIPLMTGRADLLDLDQQGICITIQGDIFDGLNMAAAFTFHPELLTGAAPEMSSAGGNSFLNRSAVHPGHHKDAA